MLLRTNERLRIGPDAEGAARLAADCFVAALGGTSTPGFVALAGGSTPRLLYSFLTEPPYRQRVIWPAISWFWTDEREVPPDHPDSNYRMASETLLRPLGVASDHIHPMPADRPDVGRAARAYEQKIRLVPAGPGGVPVFDLILLGVGSDGHTASLFPGTPAIDETRRLVVENFVPELDVWRMTMTYPLLLAARDILFLVTGAAKAEVIRRILVDADPTLPVTKLRNAPGRITWVLDTDAVRLVPPAPTS